MNNKIKDRLFIKDLGDNYVLHRIKDGILTLEGDSHHVIHGIKPFYKLSVKNCEAIKRGYDLDELAYKFNPVQKLDIEFIRNGFKAGFKMRDEMLSDKIFSEQDVISMIEKSRETGLTAEYLILSMKQTEWDVVIDTKDSWEYVDFEYKELVEVPKFDSEGCVILKIKNK